MVGWVWKIYTMTIFLFFLFCTFFPFVIIVMMKEFAGKQSANEGDPLLTAATGNNSVDII